MRTPLISVIVPVWNDEHRIRLCIEALMQQTLPAEQYEIIVVDNGSTDDTHSVASSYSGVQVLTELSPGSYSARNTGLARARGQYVAFTDSDCIPLSDWLEKGLAAVRERDGIGIVAGRVLFMQPQDTYDPVCLNYERHLSMRQDENAASGHAITANWFSPKALISELGGFNNSLKSGGDYALSERIFKSGKAVIYAADVVVQHPARARIGEITTKIRRVAGGRWQSETRSNKTLRRTKVESRNFINRLRTVLKAPDLSFGQRLELVGLLIRLWLVAIVELMRLHFGGSPTRS